MIEKVPSERLSLAKQRFCVNIARVHALTEHALTLPIEGAGEDRDRRTTLVSDLLRAVTVFLHVSLEDLLRTLQGNKGKGWSFSGRADLQRALSRLGVNPDEFRDLFHPLLSLARARISIVHYADLGALQKTSHTPRGMVELWFSCYRVLGVAFFFYRLMYVLGPTNLVEDRARENAARAFAENLAIARVLIELSEAPREERMRHFQAIAQRLDRMIDILRLTPEMFLDKDGKPLPGALEALPLL